MLAAAYFIGGNPIQIPLSEKAFIPTFQKFLLSWYLFLFILAYMGVEASASHINEQKNPQNYPLAMILLVILLPLH